jgi:hypothetical protein
MLHRAAKVCSWANPEALVIDALIEAITKNQQGLLSRHGLLVLYRCIGLVHLAAEEHKRQTGKYPATPLNACELASAYADQEAMKHKEYISNE